MVGKPPKWMVKIMVPNPIKMDDLGYHYFWKHPHDVIPSEGVKMARLLPVSGFPVFSSRIPFFNEPSASIPNKQRKNSGLEKKNDK